MTVFGVISAQAQAPPNDNFTNRITLTGTNLAFSTSNVGATREAGEPQHSSLPSSNSIWYTWTAPMAGGVVVQALNTDFSVDSPVLAIYTGTNLSTLARVASNAPPAGGGNPLNAARVVFTSSPGQAYQIVLDACYTNDNAQGSFSVSLTNTPPPLNDLFSNRLVIPSLFYETSGSFIGSSREPGEPSHGDTNLQQTLWWSWTAPTNLAATSIPVRLTCDSANQPPGIGVYQGSSVSNLAAVPLSSSLTNGMTRMVSFTATNGATYSIALAGRENDDSTTLTNFGNYRLLLNTRTLTANILNLATNSPDGSNVTFTATFVAQNLGTNTSNPLRGYISAISGASIRGSSPVIVPTNQVFFQVTTQVVLGPGQTNAAPISGTVPAPTADPGTSVAQGWGAYAQLQENPSGTTNWYTVDEVLITYGNWPNLGGVVGPGGGVIRLDPYYTSAQFIPFPVVTVSGPTNLQGGASTNYTGKAVFIDGTIVSFTNTAWTASPAQFTITTNGVLTTPKVASNTIVTVTAPYSFEGFVTNASLRLTIYAPPSFTSFKVATNGAFALTLSGFPGKTNIIEAATNPVPPASVWVPLGTNTLTNGTWNFTDAFRSNFSRRFYRARQLP